MTSRYSNPINNFILRDKENNVLAAGTLEIYEAGTSTPLAVYSDPELTSSLGSTLTADANGLIPDFHLPQGTQVKMIGKDSGGVTKWTRDNIFSLDSNADSRLDALEASINALEGAARNVILNSACQRQVTNNNREVIAAPTLTTSFAVGTVVGHYGRASNVTAGTQTRGTTTNVTAGYYAHLSGVSTNDAAAVAEMQYRVNAGDTGPFVSSSGVFTCYVYQDTGSAVDYTITFKKADSEDDFSSLTTIQASSTTSVSSATWTQLTFSHAAMGDCRNGIAIEVSAAVGVQTTKNYYFTMPQLTVGTTAVSWTQYPTENSYAGLTYTGREFPPNFLDGCTISLDADTSHDINVTACNARSSGDAVNMTLSSEITKQIDNVWAAGDDAGGWPDGLNGGTPTGLGQATRVYVFLISQPDGTTDVGFDTSTTAANLLADTTVAAAGYSYYANIGSIYLDSSDNIGGVRQRDQVKWTIRVDCGVGSGSDVMVPEGWSTAYGAANGACDVTCNFGTQNYTLVASGDDSGEVEASITDNNVFRLRRWTSGGTAVAAGSKVIHAILTLDS